MCCIVFARGKLWNSGNIKFYILEMTKMRFLIKILKWN